MGFLSRLLNLIRAMLGGVLQLPRCPIAWQPNALAPVFFGFREYEAILRGEADPGPFIARAGPGGTRPTHPVRVFFPSLDGSPASAAILRNCGRYPLIVFAHGHCPADQGDSAQFRLWFEIPSLLARSGYIVVAPKLPQIESGAPPTAADGDLALLRGFIDWIHTVWEFRDTVLPAPATGAFGHSFGGGLAARLAVESQGQIRAWASLSGHDVIQAITTLSIPKLIVFGSDFGTDNADPIPESQWNAAPRPKHRAVLNEIGHFDYLPAGRSGCEGGSGPRGPCALTPLLAQELLMMFFGRYLRPEGAPDLTSQIASSLVPPKLADLELTPEQEFFAGSFLGGFESIDSRACQVQLAWDVSPGDSGAVSKP